MSSHLLLCDPGGAGTLPALCPDPGPPERTGAARGHVAGVPPPPLLSSPPAAPAQLGQVRGASLRILAPDGGPGLPLRAPPGGRREQPGSATHPWATSGQPSSPPHPARLLSPPLTPKAALSFGCHSGGGETGGGSGGGEQQLGAVPSLGCKDCESGRGCV